MLQHLYDSPWHNPALYLFAGAATLLALARRMPFLLGWGAVFAVVAMADSYVTGNLSPLVPAHAALLGTVAVPFVILGDARFFLLAERYLSRADGAPGAPTPPAAWARAVAWSFPVPVVSFGALRLWPGAFRDLHRLFLLYEALFLCVATAWRLGVLPRRARGASPAVAAWLRRVVRFELAQYALWAAADLAILRGHDAGFAPRLAANALYYAAFVPFVVASAPREARA